MPTASANHWESLLREQLGWEKCRLKKNREIQIFLHQVGFFLANKTTMLRLFLAAV